MSAITNLPEIAELLGGEASGGQVLCPGPGHSDDDRSLSVKPDPADREGFVTHSFAGDDWKACRDHVRRKLGLSGPKPEKQKKTSGGEWTTLAEYIYRDENGEPYLKVKKCRDPEGKRQFPQFHWDRNGWVKGKPDAPKIPYRLPELIAAPKTAVIYFCEGEKDVDALVKIGFVATTASEGASAEWDLALTPYFTDRNVVILPDADVPGRAHSQKIARAVHGVAASVRVIDLYPERCDGSDVSDFITNDTAGVKLAKLVKEAGEWEPGPSIAGETSSGAEPDDPDSAEIARLAKLSSVDYDRERTTAADKMGCRVGTLDRLVQAERDKDRGSDGSGKLQGQDLKLEEVEPWDSEVDGVELFNALTAIIQDHVILDDEDAWCVALWIVYTYLVEVFRFAPRLGVTSPTRGCGKSTLFDVVRMLSLRGMSTANITAAAVFRVIERYHPALIIDEADQFLGDKKDLQGILNSGHKRGDKILRVLGENQELRAFDIFGPVAIGQIGVLPPTLIERAIPVSMKRRKKTDKEPKPIDEEKLEPFRTLARKIARWARDHKVEIGGTTAELPPEIYNRVRDNWRIMKRIAVVVGDEWPNRVDIAALRSIKNNVISDDDLLTLLLSDIQKTEFRHTIIKNEEVVYDKEGEIPSGVLVNALIELEGRPWAEMPTKDGEEGKKLSQNKLARLLKPVAVIPEMIGPKSKRVSGYKCEALKDAFERYLSETPKASEAPKEGDTNLTPSHQPIKPGTSDISEPHTGPNGCEVKKLKKTNNDGLVCGCEVANGGTRGVAQGDPFPELPAFLQRGTSEPPRKANGQWRGLSQRAVAQIVSQLESAEFQIDEDERPAEIRRQLAAYVPADFINQEIERVLAAWRDRV